MTFLGMAQNADRMLKLLAEAKVFSLDQIEHLDKKDCDEKQLPHDLICAIQSRYKVWALEMVDDAEVGLEAGEKFYNIGANGEIVPSLGLDSGDGDGPKSINGDKLMIPGFMVSPRGGKIGGKMFAFEQGEHVTPEVLKETMMESMTQVMEQFENKLWEKIEYALEGNGKKVVERMSERIDKAIEGVGKHVADCDTTMRVGLSDVSKSLERSQALLETKVEYVFAAQRTQQCEELQENVKSQFEELCYKTAQTSAQFEEKMMTTMTDRFNTVQADVTTSNERVSQLQEMHKESVGRLGGSLTQLTEECAQQVVSESKAAAYTLQAKIGILEETQQKQFLEQEDRLYSKMQLLEKNISERVKDAISSHAMVAAAHNMRTFPDTGRQISAGTIDLEATSRTLDALQNLEKNMAQMIKGSTSEQSKQIELGLGVFGAALRSQLDTMQQAELGLLKQTEANIDSKLDRLHEQGRKQTDKILTQLTLQQASGLQGPISSSFKNDTSGFHRSDTSSFKRPETAGSGGRSRRHVSPWNDD